MCTGFEAWWLYKLDLNLQNLCSLISMLKQCLELVENQQYGVNYYIGVGVKVKIFGSLFNEKAST